VTQVDKRLGRDSESKASTARIVEKMPVAKVRFPMEMRSAGRVSVGFSKTPGAMSSA